PCYCNLFLFSLSYPPTTRLYTLSLHDALPISSFRCELRQQPQRDHGEERHRAVQQCLPADQNQVRHRCQQQGRDQARRAAVDAGDRKSTRLNSSHVEISYAVFCLKKKKKRLNSTQIANSYAQLCMKKKPA